MHHYVQCSIIYNSQDMDATYVPINRWKDKEGVAYVYSGVLLSHLKEWNFVICENMVGPRENHAEWNKSD